MSRRPLAQLNQGSDQEKARERDIEIRHQASMHVWQELQSELARPQQIVIVEQVQQANRAPEVQRPTPEVAAGGQAVVEAVPERQ